ncbi:MAG TPA: transposase [Syntrophales bacterium]|nr:transposase [Syntrophales bacterium]HPQ43839.1 transposase [Syntrophales bacterium]
MPRVARIIAKNYPYHVTQRGNYRQTVFETAGDYRQYLAWLKEYSEKYSLDIWSYCLMNNHVHFVCVPRNDDSLARTLNTLHMRYSQYYNRRKGITGHLWQGRYYSSILDEVHLYAAIRYVENNPVRAGIVQEPEGYMWSSARGHCGIVSDSILSDTCHLCDEITDWSRYLRDDESVEIIDRLRVNVMSGRPCGDEDFRKSVETIIGKSLNVRPRGRPRKE